MKNRKTITLTLIGLFIFLFSIVGLTYAYWSRTLTQTGENLVYTDCLKLEVNWGSEGFTLNDAYPMTNKELLSDFFPKQMPYHFTITNTCEAEVPISINMESLTPTEDTILKDEYVDIILWEDESTDYFNQGSDKVLSFVGSRMEFDSESEVPSYKLTDNKVNDDKILTDANTAYQLHTFKLGANQTKEFSLLLFMDYDTPVDGTEVNGEKVYTNNAYWRGKITLNNYEPYQPFPKEVFNKIDQPDTSGNGLYTVEHSVEETEGLDEGWQQTEYRYAGKDPNNYVDFGEKYTTGLYLFLNRQERGDYFYSEEACKADQIEYLSNFGEGAEATECTATPNPEESYYIEFKYSEYDDLVSVEFFEDSDTCQSTLEEYKSDEYIIITDCTKLEEHYSYEIIYQDGPEENYYFSDEECTSENEYAVQAGEGICQPIYEAGDPILWRIIGLVNVQTNDGIEQRLKIVKANSIGDYSWNCEDGAYDNDWIQSTLMEMLNGIYYESSSGDCYNVDGLSSCDFTGSGLKDSTQKMIATDITWSLGGIEEPYINEVEGLVTYFYEYERGTQGGFTSPNTYEWNSKNTIGATFHSIGLIYPSDLGYATSGGTLGREGESGCFSKTLDIWGNEEYKSQCAENDWLKPDSGYLWTISPGINLPYVYYMDSNWEYFVDNETFYSYGVYPTIYLKPEVQITAGTGTKVDPFKVTCETCSLES